MIKKIAGQISRASHYGAQGNEEYKLTVFVGYDSKEFNKLKRKKQNPIRQSIVDVKNAVYSATQVASIPMVQHENDWKRASNGIKTIQMTFFMSKSQVEALGLEAKWALYETVELQSHLEATAGNLFAASAIEKHVTPHKETIVTTIRKNKSQDDTNVIHVDFVNRQRIA